MRKCVITRLTHWGVALRREKRLHNRNLRSACHFALDTKVSLPGHAKRNFVGIKKAMVTKYSELPDAPKDKMRTGARERYHQQRETACARQYLQGR